MTGGGNIPVTRPATGMEEAQLIADVLASGWITGGPRVAAFERAVAEYTGTRFAIATSSCTTALHVALHALGIGPGDEVVVPSLSFIATANAVLHAGARPVFADIELDTYNVSAETIAAVLTPRTRAIMPVHQIGLPVDLDPIVSLAERHGLIVLEDAACALGTAYKGRLIGGHTRCACFSFHPRKVITTGEGGMITTNDETLARRVRTLVNHGASMTELEKHAAQKPLLVEYPVVGFNYRMSDLQGACGLAQMQKLPELLARRRLLAQRYRRALQHIEEIVLPAEPAYATPTYQSFMIRLRHADAAGRMRFLEELKRSGIGATPGVMAIHRQPCYQSLYPHAVLPRTECAADTTVILPLYPAMTEAEQDRVVRAVEQALIGVRASWRAAG